jgi:hypothetical protein
VQPPASEPGWVRTKRFWQILFVSGAIFSYIGFGAMVVPRIGVSPSGAIDQKDPFHSLFVLENQGSLPIYSVRVSTGLNEVDYGGAWKVENSGTTDPGETFKSHGNVTVL